MDLTKLLRNRRSAEAIVAPVKIFLASLGNILKSDLAALKNDPELKSDIAFDDLIHMNIIAGDMTSGDSEKDKAPYVFITLPRKPGFLIEIESGDIRILKATQAHNLVSDFSGATVRSMTFVTRPLELARFHILDTHTARTPEGRTLSPEQVSESLLTLSLEDYGPLSNS